MTLIYIILSPFNSEWTKEEVLPVQNKIGRWLKKNKKDNLPLIEYTTAISTQRIKRDIFCIWKVLKNFISSEVIFNVKIAIFKKEKSI